MKRITAWMACWFWLTALLSGQDLHPNLRSLDNNEALAADTNDHCWNRAIKQIPLSARHGILLSAGGEIREQFRFYNNLNHGDIDAGTADDFFLLQRYLVHADLHLGSQIRLFGQLGSMFVNGKNTLSHTDKEPLAVMQAFAEFHPAGHPEIRLRIGRQDLSYANERLLGTREGPNVRQPYDGIFTTLSFRRLRADFFVVAPLVFGYGAFDNQFNRDVLFFGSYWTIGGKKQGSVDLYYFGSHRDQTLALHTQETEMRHTVGIRPYAIFGSFYVDGEVEVQGGKFGTRKINAWQIAAFAGYRWDNLPLHPRVQLRVNAASGDQDSTDNRLNLFRPLVVKSPIHDLLANGCGNLFILSPEAELRMLPRLLLTFRYYLVNRISSGDGLYTVDMQHLVRAADPDGTGYGMNVDRGVTADLSWTPDKHIGVLFSAGYFVPGDYVRNTGLGKDQFPMALKLTYRF